MKDRYLDIPNHLQEYIVDQDYDSYTAINHACWKFIMQISKSFFKNHAHPSYLDGLKKTGITIDRIPSISDMDDKLKGIGWRAVPVRGFLPPTIFMQFQAHSILPIASDMRTVNHLTYTPAPDIVHEAAGHSPIIVDKSYSKYLRNYGKAASKAINSRKDQEVYRAIRLLSDLKENPQSTKDEIDNAERLLEKSLAKHTYLSEGTYLARLNWWTVEYGLVGKIDKPKIFGAGLLSSVSESYNLIHNNVKIIPLTIDCINYTYDITEQQPQLFLAENFNHLNEVLNEYKSQMSYKKGGSISMKKAIESESVCTFELDTGIQVSGIPVEILSESNKESYFKFDGPVQLSYKNLQIEGHGGEYHSKGFSSPICNNKIISQLDNASINTGISINFGLGIRLDGVIKNKIYCDNKLLIVSFNKCKITNKEKILFDPGWGSFDLACGSSVSSVYGGPADIESYIKFMGMELPNKEKPRHLYDQSKSDRELITLYEKVDYINSQPLTNFKDIELIIKELDLSFENDWLIRFKLIKILNKYGSSTLVEKLKNKIRSIAQNDKDLLNSIKRGFKYIN